MKFLLTLFLVLVVTAVVAHLALTEPGYVLLSYGKHSLELPLIDFIVAMLFLLLIGYAFIRLFQSLSRTPAGLQKMRKKQRLVKSRRGLMQGLIEFSEGKWEQAEKHLAGSASQSEAPLLNYLAAAHAAQRQRATDRRDDYLRMAIKQDPKAEVAIGLAKAELQSRQKEHEEALATLRHLEQLAPKHRFVKKLLARQYRTLGEWKKLQELLPALRKLNCVDGDELTTIEKETFSQLLTTSTDSAAAAHLWKQIPKSLHTNIDLIQQYAEKLQSLDQDTDAEPLLRQGIESTWDESLISTYGELRLDNPTAAVNQLDKWLQQHPENPVLLTAAGKQSIRAQLWGKARSLLQESLNHSPSADAFQALGKLHELLEEPDAARAAYHSGFDLLMAEKTGPANS